MRTKNELLPLTITGMTAEGNGVGHYEGEAIFVPDTAVGDILTCRIVKPMKRYAFGITEHLDTPSPDRIAPDCPVCRACGGCLFRHLTYEAELRIKAQLVEDAFVRLGKLTPEFLPILGCAQVDGYRNKAQYPIAAAPDGSAVCGFYARRSHRLVETTDCRLQPSGFTQLVQAALQAVNAEKIPPYNEESHTGLLRHLYLRCGVHSGEVMLCFVVRKRCDALQAVAKRLTEQFPALVSVCMNINPARTNVILGDKTICLAGEPVIHDSMCGNEITLSPASFYQVNTLQAEQLYGIAADFAALTGNERLLDLYCGAGTIGLSMAKRVKSVLGVEVVPQAVENARRNAMQNQIANAEFRVGDASDVAASLANAGEAPDVIVLDPPRKGCDDGTLTAVANMAPPRVVMISCNPATAARDCARLEQLGYRTDRVRAVDLFPRTGHVECAILMTRVNPKK